MQAYFSLSGLGLQITLNSGLMKIYSKIYSKIYNKNYKKNYKKN